MERRSMLIAAAMVAFTPLASLHADAPLHRVWETSITNGAAYANKFTDVTLNATFTSPSGAATDFWGFYDGDGISGEQSGDVWKLRFMPTEVGRWEYEYTWSDGTPGGSGHFDVTSANAGKGVLQPHTTNPRWLAYNGQDAVHLKSYYIGAAFNHTLDWYEPHVYQPLLDRGYNHVMVNNGMPLAWMGPGDVPGNVWTDYDGELLDELVYTDLDPSQQNLAVWRQFEQHLTWLNDRDVGVHLFEGLTANGKRSVWRDKTVFENLTADKQEFWIRYTMSRLAPFANVAGWKYTWEKGFDEVAQTMFDLVEEYDPWDHLRDIHTTSPSGAADDSRVTWSGLSAGWVTTSTQAHDQALQLFVEGGSDNPPFMEEVIWNVAQEGRTPEQFRRIGWGIATAGAAFTWNWAAPNAGRQWASTEMFETPIDEFYDILAAVMNEYDLAAMHPADALLSNTTAPTFALAEPGEQYLVFVEDGAAFMLDLHSGSYTGFWTDTVTGQRIGIAPFSWSGGGMAMSPPGGSTDWALTLVPEPSSIAMLCLPLLLCERRHGRN